MPFAYRILLLLVSVAILSGNVSAQQQKNSTISIKKGNKIISGQIIDEQGNPLQQAQVILKGQNDKKPAVSDSNGEFFIEVPSAFDLLGESVFLINGRSVGRNQFSYHKPSSTVSIALKKQSGGNLVELVEVFDSKNQPLAGVKLTVEGTTYLTDKNGKAVITPSDGKMPDSESKFIVEGFSISSSYYVDTEQQLFLYVKAADVAGIPSELPLDNNQSSSETSIKTDVPVLGPVVQNDSFKVYQQDFTKLLTELELQKQMLADRSNQLRSEIERILDKLSSEELSSEQKNELKGYLIKLEQQLVENDVAYEEAQEKTRGLIEQMRRTLLEKDSLNMVAEEKIQIIEADKEEAERRFRRNLAIFSVIALVLSLIAGASYMVAQRIRKQKNELARTTSLLEEKVREVKERNEEISIQHNKIEEKNKFLEKAYSEISEQKTEIERKNHQITTSIRYAESIQQVILPSEEEFGEAFGDFFIFYKPKDIVSGDFYWLHNSPARKMLAVVDCTGHGVPGAFMSLIGHNLLHQEIRRYPRITPGEMLTHLNDALRKVLKQEQKVNNDCMDVCICLFEPDSDFGFVNVTFAGAKRPLLVVKQSDKLLEEIRGDKKTVGGYKKQPHYEFTNHHLRLQSGDMLYFSTDGIADQADPDMEKFSSAQLKELIQEVAIHDMKTQNRLVEERISAYQKDAPQRDDMTLIGIQL
jgi:serine phosphatase RsbU (regulator of sigma subunit)